MHTCEYLQAHAHTQNKGKDKQNITTKLYLSASSIKSITKYMLKSTVIHHNHLPFNNSFFVVDTVDDILDLYQQPQVDMPGTWTLSSSIHGPLVH
jgi:hypothetical protein